LLVWPDVAREWAEMDRKPDMRAERQVEQVLDRILLLSPEDPLRTRFSAEAQERFGVWRRELEQRVRSGHLSPAMESHLAKSRSLLPKLALIFHLAESDPSDEEITVLEAERAAAFCTYLEAHARRVYGSVASLPQRLAASLGQKLRSGQLGERFSLRDIYLHGWGELDTAERARTAVAVLVDAGWIRRGSVGNSPAGGRPTEEYLVNPAVYAHQS
jgi:putative DNA primase/helicase